MLNLLHIVDLLMVRLSMRQQLAAIGQCSLQMRSVALETCNIHLMLIRLTLYLDSTDQLDGRPC